jgi:hypothetical protein
MSKVCNAAIRSQRKCQPDLGLPRHYPQASAHCRSTTHYIRTTMLRTLSILTVVAGLVLTASGVVAAAVNKCVVNGTVTFQQGLCPLEGVRELPTIQELNDQEKKRRAAAPGKLTSTASKVSSGFRCDGRTYCSQMASCEEAKYFLANCTGVKMDGDRDGIPCEEQWCVR